jgi:hypothetical protein
MFRNQSGFELSNTAFAYNIQSMINAGRKWNWLVKRREHWLELYYAAVSSYLGEQYYEGI